MILSYVMSILAVVVLSVIADLLLSGKRMGKYVSAVFASLTILIIVAPLPNLIRNGASGQNSFLFFPDTEIDESYVEYADSLKLSVLERGVSEQLGKEGYKGVKVHIMGSASPEINITSVSINLCNLVMDEKVVHINKYDAITKLVSEFLGVDKGVIVIYE